jgi:hypothetical protein
MQDDSLVRYAQARDGVAAALSELRALVSGRVQWYGVDDDLGQLERTVLRLRDGRFVLAVVGEFSSGKSFLLNALLGKVESEERAGVKRIIGLLATDINPSTATITELRYATEERATALYADGREERIPLGRLTRFVAVGEEGKLHDATADERGLPTLVRIGIDSPFLANGFVVADTPGLASINPAHRRATLSYLPGADAVLYLVDTQQPFSDGDASFLGIIRRYIESIFIVQTKIDLWRMRDGERETWQSASARIVAQAAIHAPDVPVFPLSAREYAEGTIARDPVLVAQSRFPEFLAALDASLVATTGRSRLRRAAAESRRLATRAGDALMRDITALELDAPALRRLHAALIPALDAIDSAADVAHAALRAAGSTLRATIVARGTEMRDALQRTLARAVDTADIARLRDRAKLHIIVDDTVAAAIGRFAADIAELIAQRLRTHAKAAVGDIVAAGRAGSAAPQLDALLGAIAAERLPLTEDAATAFGADPASGTWSTDLETGLRSTIVLGALGGPAVGLVNAIAQRFAAAPYGTYMKRELLADLRAQLFDDFDTDVATYVDANAAHVETIAIRLGARVAELAKRVRGEALGAIETALATPILERQPQPHGNAPSRSPRSPPVSIRSRKCSPAKRARSAASAPIRGFRSMLRPAGKCARAPTARASIHKRTNTDSARSAGASPCWARSGAANPASSMPLPANAYWPTRAVNSRCAFPFTFATARFPMRMRSATMLLGTRFRSRRRLTPQRALPC